MKKNLIHAVTAIMIIMLGATPALAAATDGGSFTLFDRLLSLWPFIVSLAVFLLVILWYQNVQMSRKRSKGGRQTKGFNMFIIFGIIIVLVVVLLAVPWFMNRTRDEVPAENTELIISPENRVEITLTVDGMTCTGCENTIKLRVGGVEGVESVIADHQARSTKVVYDSSLTDLPQIVQAIEAAGYQVIENP